MSDAPFCVNLPFGVLSVQTDFITLDPSRYTAFVGARQRPDTERRYREAIHSWFVYEPYKAR
jgi:hypothetical protein